MPSPPVACQEIERVLRRGATAKELALAGQVSRIPSGYDSHSHGESPINGGL